MQEFIFQFSIDWIFIFIRKIEKIKINKWQYRQLTKPAHSCMLYANQWISQTNGNTIFPLFRPLGPCVQSSADNNNNTCGAILILFTIKKMNSTGRRLWAIVMTIWNVIWLTSLVFSHRLYLFFVWNMFMLLRKMVENKWIYFDGDAELNWMIAK